jgi:glycosyltransferase involved in cell wall biosynthesis
MVKCEQVQLIHSHHRWSSFLANVAKAWMRVPVVTTCHAIHQGKKALSLWGEKVICVSENARCDLIENFGVSPGRTVVIANGVNTGFYRNLRSPIAPVQGFGLDSSPCLTNVAQLMAVKGQRTLLEAMPSVWPFRLDARYP